MSDCNLNPTQNARDAAVKKAKAAGHAVVYGQPHILQLDLDSHAQWEKARNLIRHFSGHIGVKKVEWTQSKSGGWHFYVWLAHPMERLTRIFWQAALGSDRTREALNWLWAEAGNEGECFLVEMLPLEYQELKWRR
ncbi:MAG: hypothetical protein V3S94_05660 [Gammaproteobacteria bacterium]